MKADVKRKIIDATIKLIEERESRPEEITVRDICREAGVGLSQINYHFQTKENLIAQCVQVMIGDVISSFPRVLPPVQGLSAADALKQRMLSTLNYLYAHENISRISILTDHQSPRPGDNTAQTIRAYIPLVKALCEERNLPGDPAKLTTLMILAVQGMFLRSDVIKEALGIDLRSESGRREFLDAYVENAFPKFGMVD